MINEPVISIVLPVYNGARYLHEAIESIISQTFTQWELIVVDDGSTDESPAIIARFCEQDERIISVRNETNLNLKSQLAALQSQNEIFKMFADEKQHSQIIIEIW